VAAFSVIEPLDVVEDIGLGFLPCFVFSALAAFSLQRSEEALNDRVVVTTASGTHAALDVVVPADIAEVIDLVASFVLAAVIVPVFLMGRAMLGRAMGTAMLLFYLGYVVFRTVN